MKYSKLTFSWIPGHSMLLDFGCCSIVSWCFLATMARIITQEKKNICDFVVWFGMLLSAPKLQQIIFRSHLSQDWRCLHFFTVPFIINGQLFNKLGGTPLLSHTNGVHGLLLWWVAFACEGLLICCQNVE
jgi:hypothetical protein